MIPAALRRGAADAGSSDESARWTKPRCRNGPAEAEPFAPVFGRPQFARDTSTRLSEKDGAWPMSVKAPDEMLLTVPSLSWRQ